MTETGFRYAVCSLKAKRGELAGEIEQINLQLRARRRELAKVDEMLGILAPGTDPAKIPPRKAIKYMNIFRAGELSRLVMGILRAAGRPMGNVEITRAIFDRSGFGPELWSPIRERTRANLAHLEKTRRVMKLGYGPDAQWMIAGSQREHAHE